MAHTDKTDPHRVKVERYGAHYWMRIYRCCCKSCTDPTLEPKAERLRGKQQARNWQREYEDAGR